MDGSQKRAELKKTDTKKCILDGSIFMKFYHRQNYSMEREISAVAASVGDGQELTKKGP